jgi:hypothetical protein
MTAQWLGGGAGLSGGRSGSGDAFFFGTEDFAVVASFLDDFPPSTLDAEAADVKTSEARATMTKRERMAGSSTNDTAQKSDGHLRASS